jgi:hypothetical protein
MAVAVRGVHMAVAMVGSNGIGGKHTTAGDGWAKAV